MSKKVLVALALSVAFSSVSFADCKSLMSEFNAPDPSVKTMKQVKRWCKRKMKHHLDKKDELEKCLVDRAADNPNKATVAGQ